MTPDDRHGRRVRAMPLCAALLAVAAAPALAADPAGLVATLKDICLTATPPGLLDAPDGYIETGDRETFAGPAARFWMTPDESIRFGVTFSTTARSCEFVVDDRALVPAEMQKFAALSLLAIRAFAGNATDLSVTNPENIPTFRWTAMPRGYKAPFAHRAELSTNQHQTLIRSVIEIQ